MAGRGRYVYVHIEDRSFATSYTEGVTMTRMVALLFVSAVATSSWLYLASSLSLGETVWSLFLSRIGTPIVLFLAGTCVQAGRTV